LEIFSVFLFVCSSFISFSSFNSLDICQAFINKGYRVDKGTFGGMKGTFGGMKGTFGGMKGTFLKNKSFTLGWKFGIIFKT